MCFIVSCDGRPGCEPWEGEDGAPVFATEAEAVVYVEDRGWRVAGGRVVCPPCVAVEACAAEGCRFDVWGDDEVDGMVCRRRECLRCPRVEFAPPVAELRFLAFVASQLGADPTA